MYYSGVRKLPDGTLYVYLSGLEASDKVSQVFFVRPEDADYEMYLKDAVSVIELSSDG